MKIKDINIIIFAFSVSVAFNAGYYIGKKQYEETTKECKRITSAVSEDIANLKKRFDEITTLDIGLTE